MVLVLVTNHSALMHPHPFANDAVWGAHSGNIGKSARLPAFSRKNSAWHRQTHCVCLCLGHQFCRSLRIFSRCRSNSARNPRILSSRAPYTVWKVSQDLICHVSFVTHIHSYEQYHMSSCSQSKLLLPVLINHDSPNCSQSQDPSGLGVALRRSVKCFLSPPRREGCA